MRFRLLDVALLVLAAVALVVGVLVIAEGPSYDNTTRNVVMTGLPLILVGVVLAGFVLWKARRRRE